MERKAPDGRSGRAAEQEYLAAFGHLYVVSLASENQNCRGMHEHCGVILPCEGHAFHCRKGAEIRGGERAESPRLRVPSGN